MRPWGPPRHSANRIGGGFQLGRAPGVPPTTVLAPALPGIAVAPTGRTRRSQVVPQQASRGGLHGRSHLQAEAGTSVEVPRAPSVDDTHQAQIGLLGELGGRCRQRNSEDVDQLDQLVGLKLAVADQLLDLALPFTGWVVSAQMLTCWPLNRRTNVSTRTHTGGSGRNGLDRPDGSRVGWGRSAR